MGMQVLAGEDTTATAARQIETTTAILARHQPRPDGWCSCGRPLPCSVAATCERARERYQAQLALSETTVLLPVVAPLAANRSASPRRRLRR